eukprot:1040998-Lingulodinium_polyedra.AAC.1
MVVSRITARRLRAAGKSFAICSKDATNAFACSDWGAVREVIRAQLEGVGDDVVEMFRCRRELGRAKVDACDGE